MESYDGLLSAMPAIAEAVNRFRSSEVQHRAFEALLAAYGTDAAAPIALDPEPGDARDLVLPRPLGGMARPPEPNGVPGDVQV